MMKRRDKRDRALRKVSGEPVVAKIFHYGYRKVQSKWVDFMNNQTKGFNAGTWKIVLVAFVLLTGSYSLYVGIRAVSTKRQFPLATPIRTPGHLHETGELSPPAVSGKEYERIVTFRRHMDSLSESRQGKAHYDSILKQRPGLMDSIAFIENYYQQQLKQQR